MKALGIDLGTTNSIAAICERGVARTINIEGLPTLPSVVYFPEGAKSWEDAQVGKKAKSQLMMDPGNSVKSAKRFMGDLEKSWEIRGRRYTPVEISAAVIGKIRREISSELGEEIRNAVITVPAYFNGLQKNRTEQAGKMAGLNVLKLIKEPTAAAVAYGLDREKVQTIMVYDLGGGTFDVTILDVDGNRFTERAIDGDVHLGGDDFDTAVKDHIIGEFMSHFKSFSLDAFDETVVREVAEKIKMELSSTKRVEETVILGSGKYCLDIQLKRGDYQNLIQPRLDRTMEIMNRALGNAGIHRDDIGRIVLVGGSTKAPVIFDRLTDELKQPYRAENVDEIVAHGAAFMARSLAMPANAVDNRSLVVDPITPFNLGVRASGNGEHEKFSVLIHARGRIPCEETRLYSTDHDNQSSVPIGVYQGFGKYCTDPDVNFIGGFILDGIPPAGKGVPDIAVTFTQNDNDTVAVRAECSAVGTRTVNLSVRETGDPDEIFKRSAPVAVSLCIDVSYSMKGKPMRAARKAAMEYIGRKQGTGARVGCTVFATNASTVSLMTDDMGAVGNKIEGIDVNMPGCGYGTNMEKGLLEALPHLERDLAGFDRQVILLSDGYTEGDVRKVIPRFEQLGVKVHTVGAGGGYDRDLLEELATRTGGAFVPADDIEKLVEAFLILAEK